MKIVLLLLAAPLIADEDRLGIAQTVWTTYSIDGTTATVGLFYFQEKDGEIIYYANGMSNTVKVNKKGVILLPGQIPEARRNSFRGRDYFLLRFELPIWEVLQKIHMVI
ncbi:hypothetical protein Ga0100231_000570 [Opitutaceae bacterium TAV4]|nr:hypothetical protein Ga0100231_000570 [Opitutaceae bacterium TAV4]